MRDARVLLCLLPVVWISALANGQNGPCESLRPLSGSSLQYRNRGNRCEGLYEANYAAKRLALVSFTIGVIKYPLQRSIKLRVTTPNPSDTVHVRAVAKPPNIAYEMDAVLAPSLSLDWPVDDVLLPEALNATKVGIYGWKQEHGRQVFVPVSVIASGFPTPSSAGAVLTLRPSFDIQVLKWRWSAGRDGECGTPGPWQDALTAPVVAGQTLDISLQRLKGSICLDVSAQGSDSEWVQLGEEGPIRVSLP